MPNRGRAGRRHRSLESRRPAVLWGFPGPSGVAVQPHPPSHLFEPQRIQVIDLGQSHIKAAIGNAAPDESLDLKALRSHVIEPGWSGASGYLAAVEEHLTGLAKTFFHGRDPVFVSAGEVLTRTSIWPLSGILEASAPEVIRSSYSTFIESYGTRKRVVGHSYPCDGRWSTATWTSRWPTGT